MHAGHHIASSADVKHDELVHDAKRLWLWLWLWPSGTGGHLLDPTGRLSALCRAGSMFSHSNSSVLRHFLVA
jgi:hypothetical protein